MTVTNLASLLSPEHGGATKFPLQGPGRRALASVVILSAVAAACGSRLPEEALARLDRRGAALATEGPRDIVVADPITEAEMPTTSERVTGGSHPGGSTADRARTAAPVGGQSDPSEQTCVPSDDTSTGVTPTEIRVASIVTDSGPLPGATTNSYRAAASYFAMVNAKGGVCGRRLVLEMGDDGLDPSRARAEFQRLEPKVLAFAGGFAAADQGYVDLIEKTRVPYLGTVVDASGRGVENALPWSRAGIVNTGPYVYYRESNPGIDTLGLLYLDIAGVKENIGNPKEGLPRAGFTLVYESPLGAATPDYTAEVRALQDRGVEFVYLYAIEVNQQVRLIRNMRQQNYDPPLKAANVPNARLTNLLGTDADGWQFDLTYLPIFDPAEPQRSPAVATFQQWTQRVFPGDPVDFFSISGWVTAAYFVEALKNVGPNVTRERLLEELRSIEEISGDGLDGVRSPLAGEPSRCFSIVTIEKGEWHRAYPPDGGFECELGELYQWG